jgi:hypothetical protein
MEKGAAGYPSLPLHYGLTNPGVNGGGKVQRRAVADGRPKSVAPLV